MNIFDILVVASLTVSLYSVWVNIRLAQELERQKIVCMTLLEWASEQIYDKYFDDDGADGEDG